jgi:serine O-acetyltransferase
MKLYRLLCDSFRFATLLPSYLIYLWSPMRAIVDADIERWQRFNQIITRRGAFFHLMRYFPEFRTLLYYRIPRTRSFWILSGPGIPALYINTPEIGPGLYIQHGFATIVHAKSIGANCWINQQVTIGFTTYGHPVIGDNVMICAGAKVLGDIIIGDDAIIGAGAVVTKDVPPRCTVVGAPAYIVKRNGRPCREPLPSRSNRERRSGFCTTK